MGNRFRGMFMSLLLLFFYTVIIMYMLFGVLNVMYASNFIVGFLFQVIAIVILAGVILSGYFFPLENKGFYAPIIMVTVIYTLIVDCFNFVTIFFMAKSIFLLIHLILLFAYCIVSFPMFYMGRK